jgi:hypothetical protein
MKYLLLSCLIVTGILASFHVLADPYTPTTPTEPTPIPTTQVTEDNVTVRSADTKNQKTVSQIGTNHPAPPNDAPSTSNALPIESNWKARAARWFASSDTPSRRKEMREIVKALKQPCRYCHSTDFKEFTAHLKISRQMMALSAEHKVACSDCHAGKSEYTEMGRVASQMWKLAKEKKVFCGHCHVQGTRFATLTAEGEAYKGEK